MSRARLAVAACLLAAPAAAQWLHDPQSYSTGAFPSQLASGDLDGDGLADLAVLSGFSFLQPSTVTLLHGQEDGTLGSGTTLPILDITSDIGLADVTGDGILDLVATRMQFSEVDVYAGDGNGGLLAPVAADAHALPEELALGDLDLDGWVDAATGNSGNTVTVLLNASGMLAADSLTTLAGPPAALFIAPVDGDALPDVLAGLAAAPAGHGAQLLPGLGSGAVGAAQGVYANPASDFALHDLDGDGTLDLLAARNVFFSGPGLLEAALNTGTGSFSMSFSLLLTEDDVLVSVEAADVDLDGWPDVAVTSGETDQLFFLRGEGAGQFALGPFVALPGAPGEVHFADVSGDGRPDACVTARLVDAVHVLRGNDGRLQLADPAFFPAGNSPSAAVLGDMDGDGDLDALVTVHEADNVNRLLGDGRGGFSVKKSFPVPGGPLTLDVGDLDGDGDLDAAVATFEGAALQVLLGDGAGGLGPAAGFAAQPLGGSVLLRDLDGDGHLDVLAGAFVLPSLALFPGDGGGGLLPAQTIDLPTHATFTVGDLDGDLDLDLVTAHVDTLDVQVRANDGAGGFGPPTSVRVGYSPHLPHVADFDGDGELDVALAAGASAWFGSTVALLAGDGDGGLQTPVHVASPGLYTLAAGDLNGDGRSDLAGAGLHLLPDTFPVVSYHQLHVLTANGEGGFALPSVAAYDAGVGSIDLGDLDGDGRLDVVTLTGKVSDLVVVLNVSAPHPWHDLGHALAGALGPPVLTGVGWAEPGSAGALTLSNAHPLAAAALFVSPFSTPTPFKGGVLLPVPPALTIPLVTSAEGSVVLAWSSWPSLTSGSTYWLQAAVADAGAPKGVALSNALKVVQP